MKRLDITSTKKGAASLYVVIFTTILFGVITLSFIRIILSETVQSGNDDLSRSAYDSALAGVEDAKVAVNKYYNCLNGSGNNECATLYSDSNNIFGGNCDDFKLKNILLGITDSEVKIQESSSNGNTTDQAYTCVIINNVVPDYRSTLTSDTRTRVVPLGIGSTKLSSVSRVEFRWYSEINGTTFSNLNSSSSSNNLPVKNQTSIPPIISLTLLRTEADIDINDYMTPDTPDYSTMILRPTTDGVDNIDSAKIALAGRAGDQGLFFIKCDHGEFACTVNLKGSPTAPLFKSGGNAFLIVSLPYGETITDFAVTLYDANDNIIDFENVQISVDATGRANQLLRRVETRLDPSDTYFPYPDYEITLGGGGSNGLSKNFWITHNCWTEAGKCNDNGSL